MGIVRSTRFHCGIEGCRGVVSGTTQGERSEEGETVSRSYDRQNPPHHELGLQARAAMQFPPSPAGRQSHALGEPTNHERLPGCSHDAEAGVRGSSQYSRAKAHVDSKRRGHCSARIRTVGLDVDGSRFRGVGDLRETSLCVGKIQRAEVKSIQGSSPHASAFGWLPPRVARKIEVCQGQRLCVSQCEAERQETAVGLHHGAEILASRSHHRGRDLRGLEGTLRLHNFRHSLATPLVKLKVDPKTVQGVLRHEDFGTTMGLYAQSDMDSMRDAQGKFLEQLIGDRIHLLTERVQ
jgi:integrase-like protein